MDSAIDGSFPEVRRDWDPRDWDPTSCQVVAQERFCTRAMPAVGEADKVELRSRRPTIRMTVQTTTTTKKYDPKIAPSSAGR